MRIDTDVIDLIYKILEPLDNTLTGGIYKIQRPVNSNLEDIVINSLSLNNDDIQRGTYNVNIHVPDLLIKIKNQQQLYPAFKRLEELNKLTVNTINDIFNEDYTIYVLWSHTLKGVNDHYVNIRLQFISYKAYFN